MYRFDNLSSAAAALSWHRFGLAPIPIVPGTKQTAVTWAWQDALSEETITRHWTKHPDHEVGCIVGNKLLVLDADTPESVAALYRLESAHGIESKLIVKTTRGEHHHFRRAAETIARSNSHDSIAHPERLDVKTGRALVVLPPSTGKTLTRCDVERASELTEVDQAFIDSVFAHNGCEPPRESAAISHAPAARSRVKLSCLEAMLSKFNPDCSYDDWRTHLMVVHHVTDGNEDGFRLVDEWSSRGRKYPGTRELFRAKWRSFDGYSGRPVTVGTIKKMLADAGHDWLDLCDATEPQFLPCDYERIDSTAAPLHALARYSLKGRSDQLQRESVEQVPILGRLALLGQSTVFFAAPNSGKTLLTLALLAESIRAGLIDPSKVFYVDVDDSQAGVIEKVQLTDKFGCHLLAQSYRGFEAGDLLTVLAEMNDDDARGSLIVLDTIKKFTDVMDKRKSTADGKVIRRYVLRGGTCIALAHTNKRPGADGKPIYAGTSDLLEDVDCAHTLQVISAEGAPEKVVAFENIKRRGSVRQSAVYGYSAEEGISYGDLFASVRPLDDHEPLGKPQLATKLADVARSCIEAGVTTKMRLAAEIAQRSGCSKRAAIRMLESHAGTDPRRHFWTYDIRERGAKAYRLLTDNSPLP